MSGTGPKTSAIALPRRSSGALTEAGRIAADYAAFRFAQVPLPATAPPAIPTAAKPAHSRSRIAREHAAAGVRLACEGRLASAIERLQQSAELDPTVATVQHDLGLALIRAYRVEEAVTALRRAVSLTPGLISAHMNLASVLEHLARDNEAQASYETALRLDPAQHQAHAGLGKLHLARGRVALAEAAFRAAAAASADSQRARLYQVHAAMVGGRPQEAEDRLRSILAEDPACGEAHVSLGQIQAETGRLQEAAASFERGISANPDMVIAWYQFAVATKFDPSHQDYIDRMELCLRQQALTPPQRQAIHFALGKAYDDLQDYAASMRHLEAANKLRSAHRRIDRALLERQTSHTIASASSGFLGRRPDLGVDDTTPILIVGMPRSGTTLVEQILSSHPDVAAGGELGFWRERNRMGLGVFAADAPAEAVQRLAADYLAVLRSVSPDAARVTDKMPFNFAHLGVIHQVFPRATIVHCRRHPIDTCLSNFATNFLIPFDYAGDRGDLAFFYRQYRRLMAHWRQVLPPGRFIEVDYETLVSDPEPLTRRLIATCDLDWHDACLAPHQNRRAIGTASLWQARQPIYRTSVERWRRYEPWLGELRTLLAEADDETLAQQPRQV